MKYNFIFALPMLLSILISCSDNSDDSSAEGSQKQHFASDQKHALDSAGSVEQLLQNSADQRQHDINDQTGR